ncbi:GlxA family transcriptional regulator [Salinicola aestuarinus]|uniref:GlxA family transcriptional regulator n=1 Tax=Salinicola aestuarinus TaxID=1949082 RepID=UPI000DA1EB5D|nr:GlxA family transcriptional regulator [Salinicola aestuarinus]
MDVSTPEWLYPRPDLPPVLDPKEADVTINLWLLPKFSMLTLYSLLEPLRVANRFGRALFAWRLFSGDGGAVTASNGVSVDVDAALDAAGVYDNLLVVASYDAEATVRHAQWAVLRQVAAHGGLLGALDTGAFILARAGLLEGFEVALHWESHAAFVEEFPTLTLSEAAYRFDRQRLTGGGGASSLDLMLALIEREFGANLAAAVSRQLIHLRRDDTTASLARIESDPRPRSVRRAESVMEANLFQPLSIPEICRRVGQSQRQLNRLFHQHCGETIKARYLSLRLDRARQLLADSRISVTQAALAAGFGQPAHFSRVYRERFGESPRMTATRGQRRS